jgi:threonine dehydrogenase-like Zn-dependent dehydrogenase
MSIKAAVMPAPKTPVEIRTFQRPALEPGAILLETLYSEVCGTDVHLYHGQLAGVPYPIHIKLIYVRGTCHPTQSCQTAHVCLALVLESELGPAGL